MKNQENISIYDISYKTLICAKLLYILLNKVDRFIEFMMEPLFSVNWP